MTSAAGTGYRNAGFPYAQGLPVCLNQEVLLAYEEIARNAGRDVPPTNRVEVVRIQGDVDVAALSEAFGALVERHSVLRSRFEPRCGMPPTMRRLQLDAFRVTGICAPGLYEQSLVPCPEGRMRTIGLNAASTSASDRLIDDLIWTETSASFDYMAPPLIRATLLRRGHADFVLIIAVPLLVCDDESIDLLLSELFLLYERALEPGPDASLPPAGQFRDFAVGQSDLSLTAYFDRSAAYWTHRWETLESCQIDPADLAYARPEIGRLSAGSICDTLALPAPVSLEIRRCAERFDVAPFVLFLAAYGMFLAEASGRQRLAVWMNCANRGGDESDRTAGWLTNRHAVEIDLSPASSVEELIEACRSRVVRALDHQELPLPLLWYRLDRRAERRGPSVMLLWRRAPVYRGAGLEVVRPAPDVRRIALAMGVAALVSEDETGFTVTMIHSAGRFSQDSTRSALMRFGALIDKVAVGLTAGVGRLA